MFYALISGGALSFYPVFRPTIIATNELAFEGNKPFFPGSNMQALLAFYISNALKLFGFLAHFINGKWNGYDAADNES